MAGQTGLWRRVGRGALEGALYFGVVGILAKLFDPVGGLEAFAIYVGFYIIVGAVLFAIGRGVSGGITGSCVGGVIGLLLGAVLGTVVVPPIWRESPHSELGHELALQGPTLDGKEINLKDLRGKVVLIDFWATWCVHCVHELPNLQFLYDRYHQDGLEVIGVSLDTKKQDLVSFIQTNRFAWFSAIGDLATTGARVDANIPWTMGLPARFLVRSRGEPLPWPQIFFEQPDQRGEGNPLARQLGVRNPPQTFLVNREGIVVDVGLRGEALQSAVKQVLENRSLEPHVEYKPLFLGSYVGAVLGVIGGAFLGAFLQRRFSLTRGNG